MTAAAAVASSVGLQNPAPSMGLQNPLHNGLQPPCSRFVGTVRHASVVRC
jgi:hypothetical protein